MSEPPLPPLLDVIRSLRGTVSETKAELKGFYAGAAPTWGYDFTYSAAPYAYTHRLPLQALLHGCERLHNKPARTQNAETVKLTWMAGGGKRATARILPPRPFYIRQDLAVLVRHACLLNENGAATVLVIQPRKGSFLTRPGLGILAAIYKRLYLDDLEADLEILDMSAPYKYARLLRSHSLADLAVPTDKELDTIFQIFADAYDVLRNEGVERVRRPKKRPDTRPDLFDR